jgi:hypothetical protein
MGRTSEELIRQWKNGDVSIEDADDVTDVDGFTIQAKFECDDGPVTLTYGLKQEFSHKPDPDGDGTKQFNILDADPSEPTQ